MPTTNFPWLYEIFPLADEPYRMRDILRLLREKHTPSVSRSSVYRAYHALKNSVATASEVRARNENTLENAKEFDADAARLIARKVTRGRAPAPRKRGRKKK